ncbi:hypothetical protein EIP91_004252, partial [Steccherinum ochraceum]
MAPPLHHALYLPNGHKAAALPELEPPDSTGTMICFLTTFLVKPILLHLFRVAATVQDWMMRWPAVSGAFFLAFLPLLVLFVGVVVGLLAPTTRAPSAGRNPTIVSVIEELEFWTVYVEMSRREGGAPARTYNPLLWLGLVLFSAKLDHRFTHIFKTRESPWRSAKAAKRDMDHAAYARMT